MNSSWEEVTVPATLYAEVWTAQEMPGSGRFFGEHCPERMVLMKGLMTALIRHHSKANGYSQSDCANGWCENVLDRYLRRICYTCFDDRVHYEFSHEKISRMSAKPWGRSICHEHFRSPPAPYVYDDWDHACAWVNGDLRGVTHAQMKRLKALHAVRSKADALGARSARARAPRA